MASHPYCFLLTIAAVAVSYLDCDADMSRTPERTVHYHDVMDASCQQRLSDDIEACLSGYEHLLVSSRALESKPGQLQRPVARRLCRSVIQDADHICNALWQTMFSYFLRLYLSNCHNVMYHFIVWRIASAVMAVEILSVRLYLCLSVTLVLCDKTIELPIFWYHMNEQILYFFDTNSGWQMTSPST